MSVTFFEQWYAGSLKIRGYEPVSASGLPVYVYFSGVLVPIQMGARMRPADWRGCALSARCK